MHAPSANQQNTSAPGLRGLVARHPATAFLVMAFGFGWTSLIPILLAENGFGVLPIELPLNRPWQGEVQTKRRCGNQHLRIAVRFYARTAIWDYRPRG